MHKNYDNAGPDIPGLQKDFSPDAGTVADAAVADMIVFDQLGATDARGDNREVCAVVRARSPATDPPTLPGHA
jgi:hypothetical protein